MKTDKAAIFIPLKQGLFVPQATVKGRQNLYWKTERKVKKESWVGKGMGNGGKWWELRMGMSWFLGGPPHRPGIRRRRRCEEKMGEKIVEQNETRIRKIQFLIFHFINVRN